ncbi:hypothetical protein O181_130676, partial [Austropuccinia psidii MF-1]|nr:hypothetical protein [Austropuccinia psidii MF-1]
MQWVAPPPHSIEKILDPHHKTHQQRSIFLQDLERLGIEDAGSQNASQEGQEEITSG